MSAWRSSTGEDQAGNHAHPSRGATDGHSHRSAAAHPAETDAQRQTAAARHCRRYWLLITALTC